jgi:hypothetical protein
MPKANSFVEWMVGQNLNTNKLRQWNGDMTSADHGKLLRFKIQGEKGADTNTVSTTPNLLNCLLPYGPDRDL